MSQYSAASPEFCRCLESVYSLAYVSCTVYLGNEKWAALIERDAFTTRVDIGNFHSHPLLIFLVTVYVTGL